MVQGAIQVKLSRCSWLLCSQAIYAIYIIIFENIYMNYDKDVSAVTHVHPFSLYLV